MAITYSYRIEELKEGPQTGSLENIISEVIYTYKGVDENGFTSSYPGRTKLPSPSEEMFTPLNSLTEEVVIGWLEANANLDVMKQAIEHHIEQQAGITYKGSTLPWAPAEETPTSGSI